MGDLRHYPLASAAGGVTAPPGIFIVKPFTDYTVDDYASVIAVNPTGFSH